jgi:predicted Zn-dependent protease
MTSRPLSTTSTTLKSLFAHAPSPVLSGDTLRAIANEALAASSADITSVLIHHVANGVTRVSENHVRLTNSGDTLEIVVNTRFGGRNNATISFNQIDSRSIRAAVKHAEQIAHEMMGDPALTPSDMPIPPRTYGPSTVWFADTAEAMVEARQTVVPTLLKPMLDAGLRTAAFIGVYAHARLYADKQGLFSLGQETDAEITVTGWSQSDVGVLGSPGWAGQDARDWKTLDVAKVAATAARLTNLATNAVKYEPGRHMTILDRSAVAQMVRAIGRDYDARATHMGYTPLSGMKIGQKVWDERMTLRSDPNDPEGGYLPFNDGGFPQAKMTWIDQGKFANLAYDAYSAAGSGIGISNDAPASLRLEAARGPFLTVDEMISNAKQAIYVNRFANIDVIHGRSGLMTGITQGGCFLVYNGKIEKSLKDFRFVESMYFILNRLVAVGTSERAAMGYAPWHGDWPIAPTIVPPLMITDFNFVALAETV